MAQWAEIVWNWRNQFIDKNLFPMSSGVSEWASEQMSAAECANGAGSAECGKRNERNKSQHWPRGAPQYAKIAENEKA